MSKTKTIKVFDETHHLPKRLGGGILKRLIWVDEKTQKVTKYSLVYINHMLYANDNGRVLGYDNDHGYDHKHYMGTITPTHFKNFEELEETFEAEFNQITEGLKK